MISRFNLASGVSWTIIGYVYSQGIRVVTSIVLARLLAPDILGLILLINTIRMGFILLADFGIWGTIIHHKDAEQQAYYSTAWTAEIIRNTALWLACLPVAPLLARVYGLPELTLLMPVAMFSMVIASFTSPARHIAQKRLLLPRIAKFEAATATLASIALIILALVTRNVWAFIIGGFIDALITVAASFLIQKDVKPKLMLSRPHFAELMKFGKWYMLAAFVFFLSTNFDRLYLGGAIPLALLGVYGIARSIADMFNGLFQRLGSGILFPLVSAEKETPREQLHPALSRPRLKALLACAVLLALFVTVSDLIVRVVYDARYHDAAWMLPVLLVGTWFAIIANLNEGVLMGLGKPACAAAANIAKLAFLILGLLLAQRTGGLPALVLVVAVADLPRWIPLGLCQFRARLSFVRQDLLLTAAFLGLVALLQGVRLGLGFGSSFAGIVGLK